MVQIMVYIAYGLRTTVAIKKKIVPKKKVYNFLIIIPLNKINNKDYKNLNTNLNKLSKRLIRKSFNKSL